MSFSKQGICCHGIDLLQILQLTSKQKQITGRMKKGSVQYPGDVLMGVPGSTSMMKYLTITRPTT